MSQTIEDRSFDAVLGVTREKDVLLRIEFRHRIEQAQTSCPYEILQIHMNRQIFVHSNRDRLHERKMLQNNLIPAGHLVVPLRGRDIFHLYRTSLFLALPPYTAVGRSIFPNWSTSRLVQAYARSSCSAISSLDQTPSRDLPHFTLTRSPSLKGSICTSLKAPADISSAASFPFSGINALRGWVILYRPESSRSKARAQKTPPPLGVFGGESSHSFFAEF